MQLLIVDDEPIIRQGLYKMARLYTPAFKKIYTASNGIEALDIIRNVEPEIMITDIKMPKMNGVNLCRVLHEENSHTQMIVISGYNEFQYAQACLSYGVKHYLLKPATKSNVHDVLDKVINRTTLENAPVSRYMKWIERMELAIWSLQMDELNVVKEQWREYCKSVNLPLKQLKELLEDCTTILQERFQARNCVTQFNKVNPSVNTIKDALDDFEQRLQKMADDLLLSRGGNYKDPMEAAKTFIDERLSEEIFLEQVAGIVGLNPNYFSALFKKTTDETFVQYKIKKRMEKAKELLALPHYRIVDVAFEVGYEDYPHFTKTFKKIVGIPPSEFRSQLGIK